jgi:surfactin synthase thioesterase subunit
MPIRISPDFGVLVRRASLSEKGLSLDQVVAVMESEPLDRDQQLLSFGPHFGGEAADEFTRRLESLGLSFIDDFFVFECDLPAWCTVFAAVSDP